MRPYPSWSGLIETLDRRSARGCSQSDSFAAAADSGRAWVSLARYSWRGLPGSIQSGLESLVAGGRSQFQDDVFLNREVEILLSRIDQFLRLNP